MMRVSCPGRQFDSLVGRVIRQTEDGEIRGAKEAGADFGLLAFGLGNQAQIDVVAPPQKLANAQTRGAFLSVDVN